MHFLQGHVIGRPDFFEPILLSVVDEAHDVNFTVVRQLRTLLLHSLNSPILVQDGVALIMFRQVVLEKDLGFSFSCVFAHRIKCK